jgi:hypothetical protein
MTVATQPMRPLDIAALLLAMVLGLAAFGAQRALARGVAGFVGAQRRRGAQPDAGLVLIARLLVIFLSGAVVISSALVAMGIVLPRPGPYPGGAATKVAAVLGLIAFVVVALRVFTAPRQRRVARPED